MNGLNHNTANMESSGNHLLEKDCIFCQIVAGLSPCYTIWQDQHYLAFLSIFPNTDGFTVVIPKYHLSSYLFDHPLQEINNLMAATQQVAKVLVTKFPNVARTSLIFEGYGVNHLHVKVIPLHGTKDHSWKKHVVSLKQKFTTYPGYVSSHDAVRESDEKLMEIMNLLTS